MTPESAPRRPNERAQQNHDELFPGHVSTLAVTDPELIEVFDNFAFDEVLQHGTLEVRTRLMVQLAAIIASQAVREYRAMLGAALTVGVTPVEAKEILYQAVPYVGIAKVFEFLHATNEVLTERGVTIPLPGQSTTTPETRAEKGLAVQKQIVGDEVVEKLYASAPSDQQHIQRLLSANCFGDHLTRSGLDIPTRELLTLSMLAALGGCDAQVKGHVAANIHVGNDRARLIAVVTQLLPFIGYPRTLNAFRAIDEVTPAAGGSGATLPTLKEELTRQEGKRTMAQRTWLITGVSSGFGRELTEQLLKRGDRVVGTVRDTKKVADLIEQYPDAFRGEVLDVTDTAGVRDVVARAFTAMKRIDVIISNAGYGLFGAAEELTDQQVEHLVATNLVGPIHLIRAALPHLRAQGGGRVIQISSYGGQVAFPGNSLYHATKWGIEGFVESVAQEVNSFGIGMTIVEPGGARTEFRYGSAQVAKLMPEYDGNPAHAFMKMLDPKNGLAPGDPARMATRIIESADVEPAPLRMVLGSQALEGTLGVLRKRIEGFEAQKELAASTDFPPGE